MKRSPLPRGRSTINPRSTRQRVRASAITKLRAEIVARDNWTCIRCGAGLGALFDAHHRKAKSLGGRDEAANLICLDRACHTAITDDPDAIRQAEADGLVVKSWQDPASTPVRHHAAGLWWLPGPSGWVRAENAA